jgi:formylglycine-generating enzyme required for sulfatase activity
VDGATFNRGNDPARPATVSGFRLDKYEITVGRFRKFLAAYAQNMIPAGTGKNPHNASDPGWDASNWNPSLEANAEALKAAVACDPVSASFSETPGSAAAESLPING